mmetsp:Transcript_2877/g.8563  ORF Transcript_2877/g.8563 Transcript_2877/m.8563 type:complete len:867 (+) Transcript_2877:336-2936(+)
MSLEAAAVGCFNTTWAAVQSVPGAVIWQRALEDTGLNLIMDDEQYKGTVFVVLDDGITHCNTSSVYDTSVWPQGDCATRQTDWSLFLTMKDAGNSVLMSHWLPGVDQDRLKSGELLPTLLDLVLPVGSGETSRGMLSLNENEGRVSLPASSLAVEVEEDYYGGYANATVVDELDVCGGGRTVKVLDRMIYPDGMPEVPMTVIPELEGYCHKAIYPGMRDAGTFQLPARVAITNYVHPLLQTLLNPASNITVFSPRFEGELNLIEEGIVPGSRSSIKDLLALYPLLSIVAGGRCPWEFGPEGVMVNSVAAELVGKDLPMLIRQAADDPNFVDIEVLYGKRLTIRASFIGKFCHSTAYRIDRMLTPWNSTDDPSFVAGIPLELAAQLPTVKQMDMFDVSDSCIRASSLDTTGTGSMSPVTGSGSLGGGAIAGIVVGGCLATAGLVALMVWLWQKNHKKINGDGVVDLEGCKGDVEGWSVPLEKISSGLTSDDSYAGKGALDDELLLKEPEVTIDKDPVSGEPVVLGKGRFGKVYRGILLGSEAVAIKCIGGMRQHSSESSTENNGIQDESASDAEGSSGYSRVSPSHAVLESFADMSREEVLKEIRLLKSCHSQYIVSFIGAMFRPHEIRLVTELMPCGDLWNALGHGPCPRTVSWYDGGIFIAMDVAAGLNYLHEKKRVVHLDLKSSNILLRESKREPPAASATRPARPAGGAASESGAPCVSPSRSPSPSRSRSRSRSRYTGSYLAKVSDVGLSKILPTSHEYLTSMQAGGTWSWCAPEVILNAKCTSSADMYSYGVVLWEICTGEVPVRGRMRDVRVPDECPQRIADLVHNCLSSPYDLSDDGHDRTRPKACDVLEILASVLAEG